MSRTLDRRDTKSVWKRGDSKAYGRKANENLRKSTASKKQR